MLLAKTMRIRADMTVTLGRLRQSLIPDAGC
jgi:hypothetical protein